jgi:hypothetical protein
MVGGLIRLLVFRMLPRRILPLLVLYDVFRLFRRKATSSRAGRLEGHQLAGGSAPDGSSAGHSSGGDW